MNSPGKTPGIGWDRPRPDVSILMPVHNGERFLAQALDSLLGQTFPALEIIIVDDGSTDATIEIARSFAAKDARVRVFSHPVNRGAPSARNTALRNVSPTSLYVMNHDCDDVSLPGMVERLVTSLEQSPALAATGCFCDYIDENGRPMGRVLLEWRPALIRATFADLNSMVNSATLVRRAVVEEIGPFDESIGTCDDYDFWARAILRGHVLANIPEVLHLIRLHGSSIGAKQAGVMSDQARQVSARYGKGMEQGVMARVLACLLLKTLRTRSLVRRLFSRGPGIHP
jgi:glycosyltransferase involved in cell wall biosynthesis